MSRDGDYVAESIYSPFTEDTGATRARSRRRRGNTRTKKARIARMYVRILTEMCMNRFKWEGLPDSIDPRFLEWTLFRDALSVFYFDKEFDQYMALRASGRDGVNFYDNPTGFTAYGNQVFSKHLRADECVPIWANYMRLPDIDVVRIFADRLAEADRTVEIDIFASRHPYIVGVGEDERLGMMNAFRAVEEGQPVIFGSETFNARSLSEKMSVLNLQLEKGAITEMQDARYRIWNDAMTLLGISTMNSFKKERLVGAEADGADGQAAAMRGVALNARRYACDQINRMFPELNVSVDWHTEYMNNGLGPDENTEKAEEAENDG